MKPREHTTGERRRALDLLREGATMPAVVAATGVPDGTIRKWAQRAGVALPVLRRDPSAEEFATITRRVAAGERAAPVARDHGVSIHTVLRACRRAGVAVAARGRPRSTEAA